MRSMQWWNNSPINIFVQQSFFFYIFCYAFLYFSTKCFLTSNSNFILIQLQNRHEGHWKPRAAGTRIYSGTPTGRSLQALVRTPHLQPGSKVNFLAVLECVIQIQPIEPRSFLIEQLQKLVTARDNGGDVPTLLDMSNLVAIFGLIDATQRGRFICKL